MKKIILFLIAVISVLFSACVQVEPNIWGGISGVVKDFQTNQPLEGVKVTITSTGDSKITNSDGQFSFENLDAKEYTLSFEKAGYLSTTQTVRVLAGESVSAHVQMRLNLLGISVSPDYLDFGTDKTSLNLTVTATNGSSVHFEVSTSDGWLNVSPQSGNVSTTTTLRVLADRSKPAGNYEGIITITANSASMTVPVYMQIGGASEPVVRIDAVSSVSQTTATVSGQLILENGASVSEYGICYATNATPTVNDQTMSRGSSNVSQSFSFQVGSLTPGTEYHVRAYAKSNGQTYYGNTLAFTTSSSGGGGGGTEDYSSAQLRSTHDGLTIELLSCKRMQSGNIVMETTIMNTGINDNDDFRVYGVGRGQSWDGQTYTTDILDEFATEYGYYDLKMSVSGREGNEISGAVLPISAKKKFTLTIKNAPESATSISVHLATMFYGYPCEYAYLTYDNVPIY